MAEFISNRSFKRYLRCNSPIYSLGYVDFSLVLEFDFLKIRYDYINDVFIIFEMCLDNYFRPSDSQLDIVRVYFNDYLEQF